MNTFGVANLMIYVHIIIINHAKISNKMSKIKKNTSFFF